MPNILQVNELLLSTIARIINQEVEMPGVLLTVTYVKCSKDLKYAQVGVSVLPVKQGGRAIGVLKSLTKHFHHLLLGQTRLRRTPILSWVLDTTEEKAAAVEKVIAEEEKIISQL